ncbi:MAG: ABC transporter permease [Phycisphaerae bacterium]|nr:ABC transporter permease [Gemmatimonadaceae bacterium]
MGLILRLAAKSLRSRVLTTWLTVTSIALSVTLLVGIEHLRAGVRESFAGTISGTDLIVGARGGTLQVLLSTVFGIGSPAGSVSMKTFERWKSHPAVKWAVPYSLGDSHRGFRVVGTTAEFYERYRYRKTGKVEFAQGRASSTDDEVVIGYDVAERLKYVLNSPVVVTHGLVDIGTSSHESHPFHVVGILGRTFTPIDRSVYLTLEGLEAMHEVEPGRIVAAPKFGIANSTDSNGAVRRTAPAATKNPATNAGAQSATTDTSIASPGKSVPPVMPGAAPPPVMPGAAPPPVMPGAEPPPAVAAAAAAAQQAAANANKAAPPVMPGAEPPPEVAAAAAALQKSAAGKLAAERRAVVDAAKPKSPQTPSQSAFTGAPPPRAGEAGHDHGDDQITAFFIGTKNRFEALMLQREMNTDFTEPLTAVIPGVALGELFQSIGSAEVGLRVVALFAVAIGLTGMLVALYSSLDARRREMAILRSVGAGPGTIVSLLVLESGLLALLGCLIGVGLVYLGLVVGQGPIEQRFGLHLSIRMLKGPEYRYLALILASGVLVGFVPAWKAYRTSLADGLSPRS